MTDFIKLQKCIKDLKLKYKIGVAGSFARNELKSSSDIDIVVDTDMLDIPIIEEIKKSVADTFLRDCDVICLGLLKKEDEDLDILAEKIGVGKNMHSAYKEVCKDVIWL